jgi:hypothetical protein
VASVSFALFVKFKLPDEEAALIELLKGRTTLTGPYGRRFLPHQAGDDFA